MAGGAKPPRNGSFSYQKIVSLNKIGCIRKKHSSKLDVFSLICTIFATYLPNALMIFPYMKKLHFIYTLFIYVLVVMFAACTEKPKKFVIGVSQCSEDIWRDKLNNELKMGE